MIHNGTFIGVDRMGFDDQRLSGVRLPLPMSDVRRIAARDIEPTSNYDEYRPMLRNMVTRSCRDRVHAVDSLAAWQNEGGR